MRKLLIIVGIILIISPFFVAWIVSIHIIDITTSNDWIGFFAAIIGGLITFIGIYVTMNGIRDQITAQKMANVLIREQLQYEKEKNIEDRKLTVRPYITDYIDNNDYISKYTTIIFTTKTLGKYDYTDDIKINIKNIGLGPIISFRIVGLDIRSKIFHPINEVTKSLETGGVMQLHVMYIHSTPYEMDTIDIITEYSDILDNVYTQTITVVLFKEKDVLNKAMIKTISNQV